MSQMPEEIITQIESIKTSIGTMKDACDAAFEAIDVEHRGAHYWYTARDELIDFLKRGAR